MITRFVKVCSHVHLPHLTIAEYMHLIRFCLKQNRFRALGSSFWQINPNYFAVEIPIDHQVVIFSFIQSVGIAPLQSNPTSELKHSITQSEIEARLQELNIDFYYVALVAESAHRTGSAVSQVS